MEEQLTWQDLLDEEEAPEQEASNSEVTALPGEGEKPAGGVLRLCYDMQTGQGTWQDR